MTGAPTELSIIVDEGPLAALVREDVVIVVDGPDEERWEAIVEPVLDAIKTRDSTALNSALVPMTERAVSGVVIAIRWHDAADHLLYRWGHLHVAAASDAIEMTIAPRAQAEVALASIILPAELTRFGISPDGAAPLGSSTATVRTGWIACGRLQAALPARELGEIVLLPDEQHDIELIDLDDAPSEQGIPLPKPEGAEFIEPLRPDTVVQVMGVECPDGHHNPSSAVNCVFCGRRMGINHTLHSQLGPRPALGVLLLDDGTTHPIRSDVVVGRDPSQHPDVRSGKALPVVVSDPHLELSRSHFAIRLHEWDVAVVDLGSSNGTDVDHGESVASVGQDETHPLSNGDVVRAGSRKITIQLHHGLA